MDNCRRERFERFADDGSLANFDRTHPKISLLGQEIGEGLFLNDIW